MMDIEMATQNNDSSSRSTPFIIEGWLVEPAANQMRNLATGELRSLEPRLMHLLCLLASAPGAVQTRDHLINQIWPKVIVNENSLTRAVSELRKKLELDGVSKRLIDTIPKTGYRLSAQCQVRDYIPQQNTPALANDRPQATPDKLSALPVALPGFWHRHAKQWAAGALALTAIVVVSLQGFSFNPQTNVMSAPLADINLSDSEALSSLIGGRFEKVASNHSNGLTMSPADGNYGANQPLLSRDGRLFAMISYSDEGSSLLLGSTDLPNSPVTVLSTHDTLSNLQWSPVGRALLFAQTPRLSPAALLPQAQASLVMFDIDSFTTKVIQGPALESENAADKTPDRGFKLTSLSKHFDWLS
jgi:DNA-binding winged helix-turn-helix (wHTH) protein